ncbi:MAG TPA: DUF4139 domain-containing protein [Polyangiaceae bacterium]|nr:DUF4139 domain-containing protein [Polyangiaceae bacterium]
MKRRNITWLFTAALALSVSTGCARVKPVEAPKTKLGNVIVYRNGVAYFERYAEPGQKELTLRVPSERVDDFLKSLSIVDEGTGETLPISYPTLEQHDGYVAMTITLPERPGRLKITYVTESPSWKPSYRVVLDNDGKARLQGWAVVDNVSGEDWKDIRVGVGSTSALSFRYDLHSVRLVERETLTTGERLALAPPSGGSPYAVATKKVRVLGNIDAASVAALEAGEPADGPVALSTTVQSEMAEGDDWGDDVDEDRKREASKRKARRRLDGRFFDRIRQQAGQHRIRIEAFAQKGDEDPNQAAMNRANAVKNQLLANGVPEGSIEVVATGRYSRDAVRVLATDEEIAEGKERTGEPASPRDTQPVGEAHFLSDEPMSIAKDHSAMVNILNEMTDARRVFFFDPISSRGSKRYAFNAVRFVNPSRYTLDAGPFTVYAKGQFLGEGLSESILPGGTAFIPYALDRSIVVDDEVDAREEIDELLTIQRGVVTTETRRIRRTKVTFSNRGSEDAEVYLRHEVAPGFELTRDSEKARAKLQKLAGAHLFRVDVPASGAVELVIEEQAPLMKTVDIRTDGGVRAIGMFLRAKSVEPELRSKLQEVIRSHTEASNLQEKISVLEDQMAVYRTRIDEINVQLFTLEKVGQAGKLRRHLQEKMEEISERLQEATMATTQLKGDLMTLRIALQDRLADLTLERKSEIEDGELAAN